MSRVHVEDNKLKGLVKHELKNANFIAELEHTYHSFLSSNFGPKNCLTLLRNSVSNDFLTSSSSLFLQQLPFSHPCYKFINALMKAQHELYGVHATFVGILCSGLLYRSLKLEDNTAQRIIGDISEWIKASLLSNLSKEAIKFSYNINIGNLEDVLCVINGIINSKCFPSLRVEEKKHICIKIVDAFLKSIPDDKEKEFGRVHILPIEDDCSIMNSHIVDGLLYRENDYSLERITFFLKPFRETDKLKLILFTCPLDPNVEERSLIQWNSNESSLDQGVINFLSKSLRFFLKAKDIKIVANQKYIHPAIKYDLFKDGILVLERLGSVNAKRLMDMSGCSPISSFSQIHSSLVDDFIGFSCDVRVLEMQEKIFLNILPITRYQDVTFVLTGPDLHITAFLNETITTSINLLQKMITDTSVVPGGGCLESFTTFMLIQIRNESIKYLAEAYDASVTKVNMVFTVFIETLLQIAITVVGGASAKLIDYSVDSSFFHLWSSFEDTGIVDTSEERCACKLLCRHKLPAESKFISLISIKNKHYSDDDILGKVSDSKNDRDSSSTLVNLGHFSTGIKPDCVVDYLPAKMNAIRLALDGFSELFGIGIFIFDK